MGNHVDTALEQASKAMIEYWSEVAAMKCTEAGLLFGHGKLNDARIVLHEAVRIAIHIKELEDASS